MTLKINTQHKRWKTIIFLPLGRRLASLPPLLSASLGLAGGHVPRKINTWAHFVRASRGQLSFLLSGSCNPTHAHTHTHTRTRPRAYACGRTLQHSRGGLSLLTLSREECLRCAPFLTVLGTHCISRSFPLPPQCMLASLAAVTVVAGPAPHAHPVASHAHPVSSKLPRNQTPHAYAAFCVGVPAVARCPPPSHAGRGEYSGSVLLSDVPPPLREAHTPAADHVVTTCSVALQLASASPWTSLSWPHTPAPAQTPLLISQSHPSEMTPRDGPQRQIWARTFGKKFG